MIKGLTNSPHRFPRIGKLRKGAPKPERGPGKDLDYFRFDSTDAAAVAAFRAAYGEEPRSVNVLLPHASTEENFQTAMEQYGSGGLEVRCDREFMLGCRVGGKFMQCFPGKNLCQRSSSTPCECKEVGRLSVIVPELKRFAYVSVETHSINDIVNLSAQLGAIEAAFGRLDGIPMVLSRRPEKVSTPQPDGSRARREKWMLSIEVSPQWASLQLQAAQEAAMQQAQIAGAPQGPALTPALPPVNAAQLLPAAPDWRQGDLWFKVKSEFIKVRDRDRLDELTKLAFQRVAEGKLPPEARSAIQLQIDNALERLENCLPPPLEGLR